MKVCITIDLVILYNHLLFTQFNYIFYFSLDGFQIYLGFLSLINEKTKQLKTVRLCLFFFLMLLSCKFIKQLFIFYLIFNKDKI